MLDRHYYNWKEEDRIERSNIEKEARELREKKNKVLQDLAGSADSGDVCLFLFVFSTHTLLSVPLLCLFTSSMLLPLYHHCLTKFH